MVRIHRHSLALWVFLLAAIVPGCNQEGPEGPRVTGDLSGISYVYDVNGVRLADNSGIAVTAEGSGVSAVSGGDGRWILSNLPMGTYTISASKAGYGTRKQMGYQFVGGGQIWFGDLSVCELPAYTVTGLSATPGSGGLTMTGTITPDARSNSRALYFFIGPTAAVSSDPANYTLDVGWYPGLSTTFSHTFPWNLLPGITSGKTWYVIAYGANPQLFRYGDMATNRRWFACLSPTPSNVVSVVVP